MYSNFFSKFGSKKSIMILKKLLEFEFDSLICWLEINREEFSHLYIAS